MDCGGTVTGEKQTHEDVQVAIFPTLCVLVGIPVTKKAQERAEEISFSAIGAPKMNVYFLV